MNDSIQGLIGGVLVLALGCSVPAPGTDTPSGRGTSTADSSDAAAGQVTDAAGAPIATGGSRPAQDTPGGAHALAADPPSQPAAARQAAPPSADPSNDELVAITFDDLKTEMPPDSKFAPSMLPDKVAQLDGRRVRIRGFIFPSIMQQDGIREFPLVMNTRCKFGPGGQAHCIILVNLAEGVTTSFTVRPVAVEGRLRVAPWEGPDGNTWSLYHMAGERVD